MRDDSSMSQKCFRENICSYHSQLRLLPCCGAFSVEGKKSQMILLCKSVTAKRYSTVT